MSCLQYDHECKNPFNLNKVLTYGITSMVLHLRVISLCNNGQQWFQSHQIWPIAKVEINVWQQLQSMVVSFMSDCTCFMVCASIITFFTSLGNTSLFACAYAFHNFKSIFGVNCPIKFEHREKMKCK